ncbi:GTPase Era [Flavilitoribacter nigricans]|uniref:GTPase Era n=1 Tax=Flavilitoribacter nigricans (strain ATCC 23147 / DSM 23189 / NBRC 102662 / NCIMB 1420 / SS-2) TaxID=1122177 RepID=A0A2D0N0Q9_FLAN2|nr:GTPase Era [Flavilitoribacter nigricans]PHN02020.1 GTPase Era [Flavilitoribacter nigricans DSM 23189 = NBRC 102662]
MHKSGFVNIIGRPNVGKSTLTNALVGERMSIITNKPQTTRHRIIGIVNSDDYQIILSDTPGIVEDPSYQMHHAMNRFVQSTFEDGDLMLLVTEVHEKYDPDDATIEKLKNVKAPVFLIINKIDQASPEEILKLIEDWKDRIDFTEIFPISALHHTNTERLLEHIVKYLPEGPVYYPKDQFTDRPERFFTTEIIREKILEQYEQEIPYSVEVAIESFEDSTTNSGEDLARIRALIYVMRRSQKAIIIGKRGDAIKKLGIEARKALETFLERKVFLELYVKVKENWRDDDRSLQSFGYQ